MLVKLHIKELYQNLMVSDCRLYLYHSRCPNTIILYWFSFSGMHTLFLCMLLCSRSIGMLVEFTCSLILVATQQGVNVYIGRFVWVILLWKLILVSSLYEQSRGGPLNGNTKVRNKQWGGHFSWWYSQTKERWFELSLAITVFCAKLRLQELSA